MTEWFKELADRFYNNFIKDDRLDNNLVLVKKGENAHKSDSYPIEKDIRDKQKYFILVNQTKTISQYSCLRRNKNIKKEL